MPRSPRRLAGALPLFALLLVAPAGHAASLQQNVNYGGNGAIMNLYVPDAVDAQPGVLVSLHYCGGNATTAASWFTALAEQYGFIIIAPGLPSGDADGCWDVGSTQTLTHGGGSHSAAIVQMVEYTLTQYGADRSRVFATGASSGAMMTNVLLGAYPDVFAAGSALAGVPFGCWTAGDGWTSACANGNTVLSAAGWGDRVRAAYPGYSGARPRVQLFHGSADTTLAYANLAEEVKQWTNVLGLSETPSSTESNQPKPGWTRTRYTDATGAVALEVGVGQGVGHDLTTQGLWSEPIRFFGLDVDVVDPGTGGAGGGGSGGSDPGTGGVAMGGMPTGGVSTGGVSVGGMLTGGVSTGGVSVGGMLTGGVSVGGMLTGGVSVGGMLTGGLPTTGSAGSGGVTGGAAAGSVDPPLGGSANPPGVIGTDPGFPGAGPGADDGGCSCRLPGANPAPHRGGLLALCGALLLTCGRRRQTRSHLAVRRG